MERSEIPIVRWSVILWLLLVLLLLLVLGERTQGGVVVDFVVVVDGAVAPIDRREARRFPWGAGRQRLVVGEVHVRAFGDDLGVVVRIAAHSEAAVGAVVILPAGGGGDNNRNGRGLWHRLDAQVPAAAGGVHPVIRPGFERSRT